MALRGLLVVLAALPFASAGSAQAPTPPPAAHRLGRPVLQPPSAEERQATTPGRQGPGGTEQPDSKRLGHPVLTLPTPRVRGAPRQDASSPPHATASPNGR